MRDLRALLEGNISDRTVIALRGSQALDVAQLRCDIAHNAARLTNLNCRRGLLVTADTYWCLVGMMALFQIGADVILPQNATAGAVDAIRAEWDLLVSDREGEDRFCLRSGAGPATALQPIELDACRLSLFTSGSTGHPKRVDKTLAVMQREAAAVEELLGATVPSDSRVVGMVTHQHLFGLSFKLFWPLVSGRPFGARVHEFWEELLSEDIGGNAIIVSPAHLKRVGDLRLAGGETPPACLISAGAELSDEVAACSQNAFGAPLCEIYGSTETGVIGWRWRDKAANAWLPAPGVLVDVDPSGELHIDSPFLSGRDRFRTADLAEKAGAGFRLKGRTDRIVKIEGKRISLPEVEATLAGSPLVAAVALLPIGEPDITLAAVVAPSTEGAAELARLGAFRFGRLLRQSLASHHETAAMPKRWRFVAEMPTGPLGKVLQADLLALFQEEKREPDLLALRRNGQELELDLYNSPDLVQLDGHFPGMPIIPGVAQIDWVVKLAARHFGLALGAAQNYQVKFHRLTLPGTMVTLSLMHDAGRQRLSFSYKRGDDVLTSGVVRLASS